MKQYFQLDFRTVIIVVITKIAIKPIQLRFKCNPEAVQFRSNDFA
jgi:hypothetical protein